MTTRYRVAGTDDFTDDSDRIICEVDGLEIGVFYVDGEYYALANYCVHQGAPLCEGQVAGEMAVDDNWEWQYDHDPCVVTCPWHEWKFDLETGVNISDERYVTPTFETEVEDGAVYVLR